MQFVHRQQMEHHLQTEVSPIKLEAGKRERESEQHLEEQNL